MDVFFIIIFTCKFTVFFWILLKWHLIFLPIYLICANFVQKYKRYMEIIGKIIQVMPERSGTSARTGSEWRMGSYLLETTTDRFPRKMLFEVFGSDKIQQFNIQVGEMLRVSFDIDAREYQGRWYNSIRAWNVDRNLGDPMAPQVTPFGTLDTTPFDPATPQVPVQNNAPAPAAPFVSSESEEDLPF